MGKQPPDEQLKEAVVEQWTEALMVVVDDAARRTILYMSHPKARNTQSWKAIQKSVTPTLHRNNVEFEGQQGRGISNRTEAEQRKW